MMERVQVAGTGHGPAIIRKYGPLGPRRRLAYRISSFGINLFGSLIAAPQMYERDERTELTHWPERVPHSQIPITLL
jgi:hypothetical protein